jgi:hypothetical protein
MGRATEQRRRSCGRRHWLALLLIPRPNVCDLTRSPHRRGMTAICAQQTAGPDVERSFPIAPVGRGWPAGPRAHRSCSGHCPIQSTLDNTIIQTIAFDCVDRHRPQKCGATIRESAHRQVPSLARVLAFSRLLRHGGCWSHEDRSGGRGPGVSCAEVDRRRPGCSLAGQRHARVSPGPPSLAAARSAN